MFLKIKSIVLSIITLLSFTLSGNATESSAPIPLSEAITKGKQIAIFNVNDSFTDADSIQAFLESLGLGSQHKDQITQYFVTDDEVDLDAAMRLLEEEKAPEYYHDYIDIATSRPETSTYGYRVQDTAAILFPLADKLGVNINVIQGEIPDDASYNPYFGNLCTDYEERDLGYINRIHKETGSQAVIKEMQREIDEGKIIYVLNGGSFKLLSDIQEMAPDLVSQLDVTVMGFRQPMNFPPFSNPNRSWRPSWNEGIDQVSTEKFMDFASQPHSPHFKALRIVDSNTVEYGMVCDGQMHPSYKDYMLNLQPYISEAAYQNLIEAEERHEEWSGFKTKFMDPLIVFDAFGLISIPRSQGKLIESAKDYCIRLTTGEGFSAFYPDVEGMHPFSCPRANTLADEVPEYAAQYERIRAFRTQLKKAHQKAQESLGF